MFSISVSSVVVAFFTGVAVGAYIIHVAVKKSDEYDTPKRRSTDYHGSSTE